MFTYSCKEKGEITSQKIDFNYGWKFHLGDLTGAHVPEYDDSGWRQLDVPHDWSVEGKFSQEWASGTAYLPTGIGWYRKTFKVEKKPDPANYYIYFDGVMNNSEVWINGNYLGKRPNGHISFYYDMTEHIKPGSENILAVKVDHSLFADSRFYLGSGIFRNVYLIQTDPLHIDIWGVKFTTKLAPDNKRADATVAVDVINDRSSNEEVTIAASLIDQKGNTVSQAEKIISIAGGGKSKNELPLQITDPMLWSVDDPNLYKLKVQILKGDSEIDKQVQNVGVRSIRFDANQGFFLNGVNMKIKGVCVHDDGGPAFGSATPKQVWERRFRILKDGGANAIRMAHNPHPDFMYDLCDEMGLMVQDEAYDEWEYGKNKWIHGRNVGEPGHDGTNLFFKEWAERDTKDFVLRNQNHPSIIMWSIGNEIEYPNDPYTSEALNLGGNPQSPRSGFIKTLPHISTLVPVAANLVKWVKVIDQSIPVTAALAGVTMSNTTDYPQLLDVVGYNYYERNYVEDHQKWPERIIYGSENGKGLNTWAPVRDNDYISAIFLWTGVDFLGEAGRWPSNHSNAGLLDLAGDPKSDYYFQKSLWVNEPMIYMGSSRYETINIRPGTGPGPDGVNAPPQMMRLRRYSADQNYDYSAGDSVIVSCYTNCEEAELLVNGKSLGKKKLSDSPNLVINWIFPYEPGTIVAKAFKNGNEVGEHQLKTSGDPATFRASFDKEYLAAGGDLAHLKIEIVDKEGIPVTTATDVITVEVEGSGKLLGVDSGEIVDGDVDLKSNFRNAYYGKLLAFIESGSKKGKINITISSPNLESKTVSIPVK